MQTKLKQKKCKQCQTYFEPRSSTQIVCGWECAIQLNNAKRIKTEKKETRDAKLRLKSRAEWAKEAQNAFNKYIRERDKSEPCISCQRRHSGQYHAGHYRSVGAISSLRYCELNVHKQCAPCNNHLSGNIVNYRINLIKKIGIEKVEWLESYNEVVKYTIDDLKRIKKEYVDKFTNMNNNEPT